MAYLPTSKSLSDGRKTVTTAGTRVQLSTTSVPCKRIEIQAMEANTDVIVVGGATVVAGASADSGATRRGRLLFPSQSIVLTVNNLNLVYLDSVVSGEGVTYIYEN